MSLNFVWWNISGNVCHFREVSWKVGAYPSWLLPLFCCLKYVCDGWHSSSLLRNGRAVSWKDCRSLLSSWSHHDNSGLLLCERTINFQLVKISSVYLCWGGRGKILHIQPNLNDYARQLSLRYKEKAQDFSSLGRKLDDETQPTKIKSK